MNDKWRPSRDMIWVLAGVRGCVMWPTGHSLVTLFSLSMSVKDRPLHWILVRSRLIILSTYLFMGAGKAHCSLVMGFGSFRTD